MQHCGVHKHAQKTGYLHKRGGRIQTWHKRWFVLTGDMLFYYKTNQDSRPTGTIALAGNNIIRHSDERQSNASKFEIIAGSGRSFISSTHESYLMSASTAEEANAWVAAIKRALHEPYGGGMFGRSLEETMQVEARLGGSYIPILMHRCAKFIMTHGSEETGIFRLPGQTSRVQALKEQYDQGSQKDISVTEDVHTIASLLKLYLRELPEPIIPHILFDNAVRTIKAFETSQDEGIKEIDIILKQLPIINYNVLKYTSRFLNMLSLKSEVNKMNCVNLGTVFGPNLMAPKSSDPQRLIESSNVSAHFIAYIIRFQDKLFPVTTDENPPKRLSIVAPLDLTNWQDTLKASTKLGGSLFIKSDTMKTESRSRLGSVPNRLLSPSPMDGEKTIKMKAQKFLQILDSPRSRKNIFSFHESNSSLFLDCGSGRVSPIIISSPSFIADDNEIIKNNDNESEDSTSPDQIITRFSSVAGTGFDRGSDTFSPELVVNSIAREMESMEKELKLLKATLAKKKKESKLWQYRYEQERRARLAAEDQIQSLQKLVDQTFQQFALDDSDDDCCDDSDDGGEEFNGSVTNSEDSFNGSPPLIITENGVDEHLHSIIPLNIDIPSDKNRLIRHIRARSSQ